MTAKRRPGADLAELCCCWKPAGHRSTAPQQSCLPSVLVAVQMYVLTEFSPPSPAFSPHTCIISVGWSCFLNFFVKVQNCSQPQSDLSEEPLPLCSDCPIQHSTIQPNYLLSVSQLIVRSHCSLQSQSGVLAYFPYQTSELKFRQWHYLNLVFIHLSLLQLRWDSS